MIDKPFPSMVALLQRFTNGQLRLLRHYILGELIRRGQWMPHEEWTGSEKVQDWRNQ